MLTQCNKCNRRYDDEYSWTICPHYPLEINADASNFCLKHDRYKPCEHCSIEEEQTGETKPC